MLPAQVEQDLKDIEEMEKQIAAQSEPPVAPEVPAAEETAEVEPQPNLEEPTQSEPEQPELKEVETQPTEDFQQKYNTLRGKYDAEVPRLHAQVKELMGTVEELKTKLETPPQPEPEPEQKTYVTEADREEFGDDLIDVQRRVAKEVGAQYETKIARLEQVIDGLTKRLDETGGQVTEMTFEQRLHRLVPDFAQLNVDPKWVAWLDEVDPIIRGPRRMVAQQAFAQGDAEAVADYVRLFREASAPNVEQTSKKSEIEKQVAPSRTTTTTTPSSNEKRVYTEAEMNAQWDKVTTLNKAGRFDEANQLEAEISTALLEGRIR